MQRKGMLYPIALSTSLTQKRKIQPCFHYKIYLNHGIFLLYQ